ncbi:hypothetical protein I4F81_010265 [Pyropia yezoensis]|uniref:Uncharacterized protein n=1 Tax=Pyropia yezoensis TaxID=2788 RepID=A0ACC3CC70_PYRYE|nr:hypothetical protein I4F81_010265 [Neopyropia yezoensis]
MALVDVADGPTAACIATCEARALRVRSRRTPSRADPASTGGPLGGVAVEVTDDCCDIGNKVDVAMQLSGVDGGDTASERRGCNDVPATAVSAGEEEDKIVPVAGHEDGRAISGGPVFGAELDTGCEEESEILPAAAAAGGPAAVVGDPDAAVNAAVAETDSDGKVAGEEAEVTLPTRQGVPIARLYRTASAVMKEMREYVAKHVPRLASSSAAVDRAQLTGNITAEQRELAAAAYFERRNLYDAIYDDANEQQTAADLHVDQRAATWLSSWRILKDMDKFSGAAGSAANRRRGRRAGRAAGCARASGRGGGASGGGGDRDRGGRVAQPSVLKPSFLIDGDDDEEDGPATFQSRPAGTNTAKAMRAAKLSAAREAEATREALNRMARVVEYRADIAFWGGPEVKRTKEAAQWRRFEMRRRIETLAGAAWEDDVDDVTVDIGGADAATAVPTRDTTRRGYVENVPAAMAAAAIAPSPPTSMSAGDGESLDGILTEPSTEVAAEAPVSTAVTSGAGTMVVPMSPATPPATPPTTPAEQAPAATPDAVNVHVADVIDVVDLVEIEDDEEMPCTPPAVLSPRTKRRRFVESRDGQ